MIGETLIHACLTAIFPSVVKETYSSQKMSLKAAKFPSRPTHLPRHGAYHVGRYMRDIYAGVVLVIRQFSLADVAVINLGDTAICCWFSSIRTTFGIC